MEATGDDSDVTGEPATGRLLGIKGEGAGTGRVEFIGLATVLSLVPSLGGGRGDAGNAEATGGSCF